MKTVILILSFFVCGFAFSQNGYGWYIVEKSTQYKTFYFGTSTPPPLLYGTCVFVEGIIDGHLISYPFGDSITYLIYPNSMTKINEDLGSYGSFEIYDNVPINKERMMGFPKPKYWAIQNDNGYNVLLEDGKNVQVEKGAFYFDSAFFAFGGLTKLKLKKAQ